MVIKSTAFGYWHDVVHVGCGALPAIDRTCSAPRFAGQVGTADALPRLRCVDVVFTRLLAIAILCLSAAWAGSTSAGDALASRGYAHSTDGCRHIRLSGLALLLVRCCWFCQAAAVVPTWVRTGEG